MALAQQLAYTIDDVYALPDGERAELIDGQLYMMAPPNAMHQEIIFSLSRKIADYIDRKKGSCKIYLAPYAVFLNADDKNYVEPDISVICDLSKLDDRGCNGAPDWIIEVVSPGNPEHDYIHKLLLYKNAGVREYWIVDPRSEKIFVYFLCQDAFKVETYTFRDRVKVNIYDNLWVDFKELNL